MIITTFLAVTLSVFILYKKRRKMENKGVRSFVTPICFLFMPVVALFAYLFDTVGILSWTGTLILLFVGAYFTKYLPESDNTKVS